MSKLYGKGTLTEIERGKKYKIKFSGGKIPFSEQTFSSKEEIPGNAYAIDADGKPVKPRIVYSKATEEQRAEYDCWRTPVKYYQFKETFLGTR